MDGLTSGARLKKIAESQNFFELRDRTDSEELLRDIKQAIAAACNSRYVRLWLFTNANPVTIRMAKSRLDLNAIALLLQDFKVLNPTPSQEISLRWQAINQGIPTLIVDSQIATQEQTLFSL